MRKLLLLMHLICMTTVALAAPITYQGQLQEGSAPYAGGPLEITFRLYDQDQGGAPLASETHTDVEVVDGLFQVKLDFGSEAFSETPRYLEVEIGGTVLEPRQAITPAPTALNVLNMPDTEDTLAELDCSAGEVAQWDGSEWDCAVIDESDTLAELSCASGEIAKWDGSSWGCAVDENTQYSAADGLELTGTTFSLDTGFVDGRFWKIGGNEFPNSNARILGTLNNSPLEIHVDGRRAFRFQPASFGNQEPNLVGGHESNVVLGTSTRGATIAGGGEEFDERANTISGNWGFIGGGSGNLVEGSYGMVGGGLANRALDSGAVVGGGTLNQASGMRAVVTGGFQNQAIGNVSVVPGGSFNRAQGNQSFAAGVNARALHDRSFVWSSIASDPGFSSTGENQFLIAADGGVGVNTNSPQASLDVEGDTRLGGAVSVGFSDSEDMPPPEGFERPTLYSLESADVESLVLGMGNSEDPFVSFRSVRTLFTALNTLRIHRPLESASLAQAANLIVEGQALVEDQFVVEGNTQLQGSLRTGGPFGIGVLSPEAAVHVDTETEDPMRLEVDGQTALRVAANGGLSVGTGFPAPDNGIRTSGPVRVGQFLSGTIEVCRQTTGSLADCSSSKRYKEDIQSLDRAGELVAALRPVRYAWKSSGDEDIGLIAEEVAEILPQIVTRNEDGSIEGVQYSRIGPLLVAAFQEREAYWAEFRHDSEQRLAALEEENAELRQLAERNAKLEERLARLEAVLTNDVRMSEATP